MSKEGETLLFFHCFPCCRGVHSGKKAMQKVPMNLKTGFRPDLFLDEKLSGFSMKPRENRRFPDKIGLEFFFWKWLSWH